MFNLSDNELTKAKRSHMLPGWHPCTLNEKHFKLGQRNNSGVSRELWGRERGGRLLDSQHVQIWQSFAQGWPTQRHCAPVIAALQQQMKLSAGRWLYSDSRSTLSLQSVADKYVGFQSCQGRRWTVGQGAKRAPKAFPSPRNLLSMSLVTSPGHPFSVSHPKGPGAPDLTQCLPGEFCEPLSPCDSHHSLCVSLAVLATLESWKYPPNSENATKEFKALMAECDSVW